ncbi:MAG: MMPL family transporter [Proteobacteria bacterium]|nr:MMPL family transporter [Pseudomonadota bacterium]
MRYAEAVIRLRWLILLFTVAVVVVAGAGMGKLGFNNDDRVFFSSDNPQLLALEEFENTYNKESNVIMMVEPKEGDVFTASTLGAIQELTEASWQIPYSSRVDSITNYQHTIVAEDDLVVGDLVSDPENMSADELAKVRSIALGEPMLVNRMISPDGTMTAVVATILKPEDKDVIMEVDAYADKMVEQFKSDHPELNLYLTGAIPFDMAFAEVSQQDMSTLIPAMFAVLVIGIYLFIRSLAGTFATVLVIVFATIAAMGLAGWYGMSITAPTGMAPIIILTIAVADSVHILTTMLQEMRRGATKHEAIVESMRINLMPVFLTSVTTAIGFLSMNFSDAPPFRDLGNIAATGVGAAFLFSVLLLPAVMAILPIRVSKCATTMANRTATERLGEFVVSNKKPLFIAMSAIIIIMGLGTLKLELDDKFREYFDERYAIRTETDYVEQKFMGMDIIEISLPAGSENGINEPAYLNKLESLASHMRGAKGVVHVNSITDIIKKLNKTMHGDDEAYYRIPDRRDLIAQYLLLYEMSLPFGLDLNSTLNIDKSASRMSISIKDMSAVEMRQMEADLADWMKENTPDIYSYPTGISLMFAHISERNINGMLTGSALALVLISGILILALRSVKVGLISLIPNLFPAFMAFGLWGYTFGRVGLAVSIVSVISLGIVVDDTVHFLSKYLRARRELGMGTEDAVRYTFKTVGKAIITTSVVLTAGFLVLTLSGFRINLSMGLLTAFAVTFALFADLFFLPPMLMWFEKGNHYGKKD